LLNGNALNRININQMETDAKIHILIPAFNEEKKISSVVSSLRNQGYNKILVVNDGSRDETGSVARKAGAEVLEMPINRGQGAALSAGLEYLQEKQNPDIIVTFDADGQHQPEDIEKLVTPLLEDKADIVLGSRFLGTDSQVPLARKAVLKAGIVFTNLVSGVKLSDTHNGLRALGRKAIHSIRISQRGMTHASEIIDEIARHKLKYEEVPVEIIYSDYSKAKGQRTSGFLKLGLKFIINKLSK